MRAVPASSLGLERLVEVWNAAYAGYFVPMSWDVAQLRRHVDGGSIDLDRSPVWMDGADPAALSLLGVRPAPQPSAASAHSTFTSSVHDPPSGSERARADGEHSTGRGGAEWSVENLPPPESSVQNVSLPESSVQNVLGERGWIGGFGIASSHRGRGLAAGLMREQLDVALDSGVGHVQLEVLTQNWAARSYERTGFVTTRRLLVLQGTLDANHSPAAAEVSRGLWLDATDVPDLEGQLRRLHATYAAAWTREVQSALHDTAGLVCLAVGSVDEAEGMLLLREQGNALHVVDAAARDEAAAQSLVAALADEHAGRECRMVNEPEGSPLAAALATAGLVEVLAQYEMHWSA